MWLKRISSRPQANTARNFQNFLVIAKISASDFPGYRCLEHRAQSIASDRLARTHTAIFKRVYILQYQTPAPKELFFANKRSAKFAKLLF